MPEYVKRGEVLKVLKVHYQTLYRMEERGEIDSIKSDTGRRLYNLKKYMKDNNIQNIEKIKIAYARVSSNKQKNDLKNQIKLLEEEYPDHEIVTDIGSGLNMKREGLQKIIKLAIEGKIEEVVITYKDRLARFGYDMIEWLIEEYSDGKIIILNKNEEETPEEEITKDVMQIMNVYVAKINGRRRYKSDK